MAVKCKNCGGAHPLWECSIAIVHKERPPEKGKSVGSEEGTQALASSTLSKSKMGRPRTGYIKAEYNRAYSADQRTIKRLGLNCSVKEYRKGK